MLTSPGVGQRRGGGGRVEEEDLSGGRVEDKASMDEEGVVDVDEETDSLHRRQVDVILQID
jgi:hypothetical protein